MCCGIFIYQYAALHFAASIGIAATGGQDLFELKSRISFERNRFILQFQIKIRVAEKHVQIFAQSPSPPHHSAIQNVQLGQKFRRKMASLIYTVKNDSGKHLVS
jgi:hypothetical protein